MKSYLFLFLAIICELTGTTFIKKAEGFTRLGPSIIVVVAMVAAFYFLSIATKTIPIGVAYAIWSGVGIVFITAIGAIVFKQVPDVYAVIGLSLIVAGVLVINLLSKTGGH